MDGLAPVLKVTALFQPWRSHGGPFYSGSKASPAMAGGLLVGIGHADGCSLCKGAGQDLQAGRQPGIIVAHGHSYGRGACGGGYLGGVVACTPAARVKRLLVSGALASCGLHHGV